VTRQPSAGCRQDHADLIHRYCHALDTRDWDLLASLFTKDAVFVARMVTAGKPGPDDAHVVGRGAIVAKISHIWELLGSTHHMVSNHMLSAADDGLSASGSCYVRAHHASASDRPAMFEESLGRFDFETVLIDAAWRIRRWEENIFAILGTPEVFGGR
jgi:hypothetical protein